MALTSVLHGLPLGYHRDLQEDKEPAFDAADTLELVLPALVGVVETVRFDPEAMRAAARRKGSTRRTSRRRSCTKACRSARRIAARASC